MQSLVVVHYDEIALKRGRRRYFARKLAENISIALAALGRPPIESLHDRILVGPLPAERLAEVQARLEEVPGIAWLAAVRRLPLALDSFAAIADEVAARPAVRSFRVRAQRANKEFPLNSPAIERELGRLIQERTGWPVDLTGAELAVHVDVTDRAIMTHHMRRPGLGGLPVGSSGKLVALLSGGIDSPVAAFKMMCRGCGIVFVHFHNFSPESHSVRRKIVALVEQLARFQPATQLYLVPFARVQADLVAAIPPRLRMIAYRRAMLRLAEPIAAREHAKGFVMGDSVGQVASQTLDNLAATWPAAQRPVFAPLIGESKRATTDVARRIGTFDISALPYEDCCQLLVARSPATSCSLAEITALEAALPFDRHLAEARAEAEIIEFKPPPETRSVSEAPTVTRSVSEAPVGFPDTDN